MPKIDVLNMAGAKVSEIELCESIFAIEPNTSAMHIAVVNYLANQRLMTFMAQKQRDGEGGKKGKKGKGDAGE